MRQSTWPIGCGKEFKGVYHIHRDETILYESGHGHEIQEVRIIKGLDNPELDEQVGADLAESVREELELVMGACPEFDHELFLAGELTPVYFGTALGNFGVDHMLDGLTKWAPACRRTRQAVERDVEATEEEVLQASYLRSKQTWTLNTVTVLPFMRIVSGTYTQGMKMNHVRTGKKVSISDAVTFMAGDRSRAENAYAGDIIGLHNHGTIQIGDTFTQGEALKFSGIPNFAPELFRRIRLKDPLKQKQLLKGLVQLSEEGAVQVFRPLQNNDLIVGAVGVLQFDVVVARLKAEYNVEAIYEGVNV